MMDTMEVEGLHRPFKVDRPLTAQEKNPRFYIKEPSGAEPLNLLGTLRMNSTYLEFRDKFLMRKGEWGMWSAIGVTLSWVMFVVGMVFFVPAIPDVLNGTEREPIAVVFGILLVTAFAIGFPWFAWRYRCGKDFFRYTHYPIRFNRRNRKVYFFRLDGTVCVVDWEKLYATLGKAKDGDVWEVRLHVLAEDGETVLETYALGYAGKATDPGVLAQWEFIRLYMEEGPEKLLPLLEDIDIHDIVDRRETFGRGFKLLEMQFGFVMAPLVFLAAITRHYAMKTCKIPRWPEEVERECAFAEGDPYEVDARRLPSEAKAALGLPVEEEVYRRV
ncbi:MAG: hypothetical protein LBF61_07880 [Azoarcus sp.]|jgi:hypothetical protein|nr:hypothetical protein [Azoarcus sp.]